ncbi:carboxypeptidase-like regulatory domain-containing protein [Luteimonas fraxinea]|uniref:Carboxypeptidase regulatory-like domain-containing protein n=1 Tax=Luteimonas fraxinea TaxID=2901869 RepID=A0ABS8UCR5_9GAMM|nr:carboxypeptidase-like regulatory domain-containing protein [Luteimonas fraxinea]MCD9097029.1 hypothetical protein [Luteimonas fraxinea]
MAFANKVEIPGFSNCGGLRRLYDRGTGVVSGVSKIAGLPAPCRVFLHESNGALRGFRRTGANGTYSFIGLPPGEYRLVIEDDNKTLNRSKVEHVVVS